MLSCLIVDDEQSAIDILKSFVEKVPFLKLIDTTTRPLAALEMVGRQPIDLIFLDINMPEISGLEFMKLIPSQTKVVLTTAYSEFALQGFEQEALDYLLKPIAFERFLKAAQKAINQSSVNTANWQPVEMESDYIFVKTENKGKMVKVNFNEITYVEGLKNYLSIYTKDDRIIALLNVKDLEEALPANHFMRVHKSYIVSLDKIKAVDGNMIYLKDMKAHIPLGETYRTIFFNTLQQRIMGGKK